MKSFIPVTLLLCIGLLNGCASTEPDSPQLVSAETRLQEKVSQYPNDSLALRELVQYQLDTFDKEPDFALFKRLENNLQKGLKVAPSERFFAYHYYRINLQLAFVEGQYDQSKWQAFYKEHPFLARLDLAPPIYLNYLLNDLQGADKVAVLQQSLQDNPFFMNAYLELARHYYQADKVELASYVMQAARKHNEEAVEVLSDLIHYRSSYVMQQMCHSDVDYAFPALVENARTLTKMAPDEAFFQSQLADTFRLSGKYPLAIFAAAKAAELDQSYQDFLIELYLWDTRLDKIDNFVGDESQQKNELIVLTKLYSSISAENWQQAARLANTFSTLEDASAYGVIYGAYSAAITGDPENRDKLLSVLGTTIELDEWQQQMLAFAQGNINEAQLMTAADDRCKQTEALFVAALHHIENGQQKKADSYWQRIIDLGVVNYFEYGTARNRVKALKAASQAH